MTTHSTPLNAETAYVIAAICLFSTGHWIGCALCLGLAYFTSANDRKSRERSNVPADEIGDRSSLPSIESQPHQGVHGDDADHGATVVAAGTATKDPWKPDSNT